MNNSVLSLPSQAGLVAEKPSVVTKIQDIIKTLFSVMQSHPQSHPLGDAVNNGRSSNGNINKKFKKNYLYILPIVAVVLLAGFFLTRALSSSGNTGQAVMGNQQRVDVNKALATQNINKLITFPVKDAAGKEVTRIKYLLETAELRDEIVLKGTKATAVQGRVFLIINLKITNDYNKALQINSRDFIRLTVNNESERLAPNIHNDPVEVQAISTTRTRVGFSIAESDKNLTLYVGEINGDKEELKLNLSK
jgi:hypothetical protein